jgi:hypothetical protein
MGPHWDNIGSSGAILGANLGIQPWPNQAKGHNFGDQPLDLSWDQPWDQTLGSNPENQLWDLTVGLNRATQTGDSNLGPNLGLQPWEQTFGTNLWLQPWKPMLRPYPARVTTLGKTLGPKHRTTFGGQLWDQTSGSNLGTQTLPQPYDPTLGPNFETQPWESSLDPWTQLDPVSPSLYFGRSDKCTSWAAVTAKISPERGVVFFVLLYFKLPFACYLWFNIRITKLTRNHQILNFAQSCPEERNCSEKYDNILIESSINGFWSAITEEEPRQL